MYYSLAPSPYQIISQHYVNLLFQRFLTGIRDFAMVSTLPTHPNWKTQEVSHGTPGRLTPVTLPFTQ